MKYGLIGEKLSHSFSKEIHEYIAGYTYELCELSKDMLPSFFEKREFSAINVTMPYKNTVITYLDWVSDVAKELQAVNTIVNRNGKLYGYNTDYLGLTDMIKKSGIPIENKKVLVLGTGGTSRTSALVAKVLGAREVILVSRSVSQNAITYDEALLHHSDAEIIINATPVGMYPVPYSSPLDVSRFNKLRAVFDAVYNPLRTSIVLDTQNSGAYGESGLYMLVSQAVHAIELFVGKDIDPAKANEVYKKIIKEKENIVLIGMPSSGKTTVGTLLSQMLGRKLVDLDDEIEAKLGCTIAQYFENHTEKDFRDVEEQVTKEISMQNGIIIATGGGCILREANVRALRSNGRIYFIDRHKEELVPTFSRPLARQSSDIEKLYQIRYPIYLDTCDVRIDASASPESVALRIREEFNK